MSRSGPEIHYHVAETLSKQQANKLSMQHVAVHTEGAARVVQRVVRVSLGLFVRVSLGLCDQVCPACCDGKSWSVCVTRVVQRVVMVSLGLCDQVCAACCEGKSWSV